MRRIWKKVQSKLSLTPFLKGEFLIPFLMHISPEDVSGVWKGFSSDKYESLKLSLDMQEDLLKMQAMRK